MQQIRAFISDLDGTLLNDAHQMTDRTAQALRRVMARGVKVILASGRSAASIRPMIARVGTPWPYIAYNGAQILDAETNLVLSASEIPVPVAAEVLSWLEARKVYAQYYEGDTWFYESPCPMSETYGKSTGIPGTRAPDRLSASVRRPTPKVLAVDTPERVQELIREGSGAFSLPLTLTISHPSFLEITMPDATKGHAVRKLAAMLSLTPETTLCAGDSLNDLSMLEWSDFPVTVADAREEVRAVAWRVAGKASDDGVAALLDELIPGA